MKKILLLLITTILLTGCSSTYEIEITENNINDKITITTDSKNVNNATQTATDLFTLKLGEWENGHDFYKRELITTENTTGYQYTYSFNYNEYDAMSQIRKCYKDFEFKYDDKISLSTSNEFLCKTYYPEVKKHTIKITSKYKISSNADSTKNNIHIWNIDSKNYKNKPIELRIDKQIYKKENKKNNDYIKHILFILFFIILVIILIKRKKDIKI